MSVAMFGVYILKRIGLSTRLTGSDQWLYPVFYIGFPAGILLHNLYTSSDLTTDIPLYFAALAPPVFGFLQVVFLDPERKNGIYLLALVANLLSLWGLMSTILDYPILMVSSAIYFLSLIYIVIRIKGDWGNYYRLIISVFFLTVISSPMLMIWILFVYELV